MAEIRRYERPLVIVHLVATFFMVGMIWTVHHLHYPLFALVGEDSYIAFQQEHVDRIGPLLIVPWLAEGVTLLGLLALSFLGGRRDLRLPTAMNSIAMAVVLIISGFWSAPAHGDLSDGFDADVHDRLMNANLVRSLAWTVCGIAALWTIVRVWSPSSIRDQENKNS